MDEAKNKALQSLLAPLEQIVAFDPLELAERQELGEDNFRQGKSVFQETVSFAKEAIVLPLDCLPIKFLQDLHGPAQNVAQRFKEVASFKITGEQNPEDRRNELLRRVEQDCLALQKPLMSYIAYLRFKDQGRKLDELLESAEKRIPTTLHDLDDIKKELKDIVQKARDAAGSIGVAHHASRFDELAAEHRRASRIWLAVAGALALTTIGVAIAFLRWLPADGAISSAATIQRVATKLVVISLVYVAAVWASRNYRAHRHLFVVNKHRQTALGTFETFVKAANDDVTKNAVLLEATRCIFSPSVTGYLGSEEETPGKNIIEVLTKAVGRSD